MRSWSWIFSSLIAGASLMILLLLIGWSVLLIDFRLPDGQPDNSAIRGFAALFFMAPIITVILSFFYAIVFYILPALLHK
ncbi:hypothetical protein [Acinetobacter stercoris]|uniref:Uncharacterized protein n=1 Tax=Acinetobacter stercoris TaxID=2126983 RepID=A0A2U3N452_9GAMM|nr:hypothetical protein [Acinetobacter stercoris]SPL72339.1 hypothetical protein KPC_3517 [Acinetobacter stercoris]